MATETLRPNGEGYLTECNPNDTVNWEMVDEEVEDGGATQVWSTNANYLTDLYTIADHSVGSGTINFIKVCGVGWYTSASGDADRASWRLVIRSGTTIGYGDEEWLPKLVENRQFFSHQWDTNPDTGSPWTWGEIDSLQIGISLRDPISSDGGCSRCTQVYVEVDYTPGETPKTSSDSGSGVEAFVARLMATVDAGSGVETVIEVGDQLKELFASELGEGVDLLTAKIEKPTKGGGMRLWT